MKIGILNCLKANECCAGAACLKALNNRVRSFERYDGKKCRTHCLCPLQWLRCRH